DLADCPPSDTRWRRVCLRRSRLPSGLLQIRRQGVKGLRRSTAEKPNYRRRRLLCARRERPGCGRTAEQRDEVAPPHSITSSASESTSGGMESPSALAVLRLITSSNLVDVSTGRSAGFAPLRIFAV